MRNDTESIFSELLEICEDFFTWHAEHFEDFSQEINSELLCLSNRCEEAIKQVKEYSDVRYMV